MPIFPKDFDFKYHGRFEALRYTVLLGVPLLAAYFWSRADFREHNIQRHIVFKDPPPIEMAAELPEDVQRRIEERARNYVQEVRNAKNT